MAREGDGGTAMAEVTSSAKSTVMTGATTAMTMATAKVDERGASATTRAAYGITRKERDDKAVSMSVRVGGVRRTLVAMREDDGSKGVVSLMLSSKEIESGRITYRSGESITHIDGDDLIVSVTCVMALAVTYICMLLSEAVVYTDGTLTRMAPEGGMEA